VSNDVKELSDSSYDLSDTAMEPESGGGVSLPNGIPARRADLTKEVSSFIAVDVSQVYVFRRLTVTVRCIWSCIVKCSKSVQFRMSLTLKCTPFTKVENVNFINFSLCSVC